MAIPLELTDILEKALEEVEQDSSHNLKPYTRLTIYQCLADDTNLNGQLYKQFSETKQFHLTEGHHKLINLIIL